jgi:hypothetical protein
MKTIGKALIGLALVMILMPGELGGVARADLITFDPDSSVIQKLLDGLLNGGKYQIMSALTLSSDLTMSSGSALFVGGTFISPEDWHIIGAVRVGPLPPKEEFNTFFGADFFGNISPAGISDFTATTGVSYCGVGIFASGPITIGSLEINFENSYTPQDGDKFLVAVSQNGSISIPNSLSSNLPNNFQISFVDPPFTIGNIGYEYAYVRVSAVPEPATILLFGSAVVGLAVIRCKRSMKSEMS